MRVLAIDPGNTQSGFVLYDAYDKRVMEAGILTNADMLATLGRMRQFNPILAIEMMRARGMPASNEAFETLVWLGRFQQAWYDPEGVVLAYRADVKLHICGSAKAKDTNVNAALRDLIGARGTKKKPGPTFGVTDHAWAALAVAVFVSDQLKGKKDAFTSAVDGRPALRRRARL